MIFQSIIIPFEYEEMIFANASVFGKGLGFVLSFTGKMIGTIILLKIGELFSKKIIRFKGFDKFKDRKYICLLLRLIPINFDFMSLVMGLLLLDFKKSLLYSTIFIFVPSLVYSFTETYLDYSVELGVIGIRVISLIAIFFISFIKDKKAFS